MSVSGGYCRRQIEVARELLNCQIRVILAMQRPGPSVDTVRRSRAQTQRSARKNHCTGTLARTNLRANAVHGQSKIERRPGGAARRPGRAAQPRGPVRGSGGDGPRAG